MQPDARRRGDTRSWFEKAQKDLRCAQIDLAADPPALEDALYHCQQAAEKSLKGFLVWHDQPFPKTHDLGRLGKQAVELDQTLEPLIDEVVEFTKYAWMFRYPRHRRPLCGRSRRRSAQGHGVCRGDDDPVAQGSTLTPRARWVRGGINGD